MNNIIKFTMAAGILALMGCSGDNVSGAAIEGNAIAKNSSSSITSSSETSSSDSNVGEHSIDFTTKPTQIVALTRGEASVYGDEFGAEATCSSAYRSYLARFNVGYAHMFEKSMMISNFGDACDSIFDKFKNSCSSGVVSVSSEGACNNNGTFKAFCYLSKTDSVTVCSDGRNCESKGPVSEAVFDSIVTEFLKESREICDDIAVDVDSTKTENGYAELPSYSAVGIDTNSSRSFIIKPNVEALNVSDAERSVLDSFARAFPAKSEVDAFGGLTVYDAARWYVFSPSSEKYYVGASSNRCKVDAIREEYGLKRDANWSTGAYGSLDVTFLYNTILQYSDSVIVYLVAGSMSATERESVETLFRTECESTVGSFYDYPSKGMTNNVGMACAVKNFSDITFDAILGQQTDLCENMYMTLVQPVLD